MLLEPFFANLKDLLGIKRVNLASKYNYLYNKLSHTYMYSFKNTSNTCFLNKALLMHTNTSLIHRCSSFGPSENLCKSKSHKSLCLHCTSDKLLLILVVNIEVCVIEKTCDEYQHNQTTDYPVNPGLKISKSPTIKAMLTLG